MRFIGQVYPWDLVYDASRASRLIDAGVEEISLAFGYHATRAISWRANGEPVIVNRPRSSLYLAASPADRGASAPRSSREDSEFLERTLESASQAGLAVRAWLPVAHFDGFPERAARLAVRDAWDNASTFALCPSNPAVRTEAAAVIQAAIGQTGLRKYHLEATAQMGFAHGVAHDKSALAGLEDWQNVLLSLCFCDACRAGLDRAGHDPFALVASIRAGFAKRSAAVEEAVVSVLAYRAQVAHTVAAELAAVINATEAAFVAISATVRLDEFGSFAPLPVAPQGVGGLVAQLSAPNGAGWADAQRWRENPQLCVAGMFELEGRRLNIPAALHADAREAGTDPDVLDEVYLYHVGSLPPDRISALSLHS